MASRDEVEKIRFLPNNLTGHAGKVLAVSGDEKSLVPSNAGSGNLRSDGGVQMDVGYNPSADQDIATVKKVADDIAAAKALGFPGNSFLTGGVNGLLVRKTGNVQVTVTAGSAMDSTNTTLLELSVDKTVDIVSPSGTRPYHLFLGDDDTCKFSTDPNGADTGYTRQRWVFQVSLVGGTEIVDFTSNGNTILHSAASMCKLAHTTATNITLDHSAFIYTPRVSHVAYGCLYTGYLYSSADSTKRIESVIGYSNVYSLPDTNLSAWAAPAYSKINFLPYSDDRTFWSTTAHATLTWALFRGYKIKR